MTQQWFVCVTQRLLKNFLCCHASIFLKKNKMSANKLQTWSHNFSSMCHTFSAECTIGMVWGLTSLKHYGTMALWHYGTMALWHYGTMALWHYGTMALWHYGTMALWHYGTMALWHYGTMALWHYGNKV